MNTQRRILWAALMAVIMLMGAETRVATAATYIPTSSGTTPWNDANRWSPTGIPTSGDTAGFYTTITANRFVQITDGQPILNIVFNQNSVFRYNIWDNTGARLFLSDVGSVTSAPANANHLPDQIQVPVVIQAGWPASPRIRVRRLTSRWCSTSMPP